MIEAARQRVGTQGNDVATGSHSDDLDMSVTAIETERNIIVSTDFAELNCALEVGMSRPLAEGGHRKCESLGYQARLLITSRHEPLDFRFIMRAIYPPRIAFERLLVKQGGPAKCGDLISLTSFAFIALRNFVRSSLIAATNHLDQRSQSPRSEF